MAAVKRAPPRGRGGAGRARAQAVAPGLARLWAPWRMTYLRAAHEPAGCLFCRVRRGGRDREHLVLGRRPHALLMLNRYPYTSAHLMAAVTRHVGSFAELTDAERADLLDLTALAERALAVEYRPDGLNVGANLGRVAGAGFPGHLHVHLVPRWDGDTNFMPAVAATRVLPESLAATWRRLRRALAALAPAAPRSRPRQQARADRSGGSRSGRGRR